MVGQGAVVDGDIGELGADGAAVSAGGVVRQRAIADREEAVVIDAAPVAGATAVGNRQPVKGDRAAGDKRAGADVENAAGVVAADCEVRRAGPVNSDDPADE